MKHSPLMRFVPIKRRGLRHATIHGKDSHGEPMTEKVMVRTTLKRRGKRMKSVRKKLWSEFSLLIRQRDKRCQFAGYFKGRCGGSLQAAHIFPKGKYPLIELHPLNVVAACAACHLYGWHRSPPDAARWMESQPDRMARLHHALDTCLERKGWTAEQYRAEWKAYGL